MLVEKQNDWSQKEIADLAKQYVGTGFLKPPLKLLNLNKAQLATATKDLFGQMKSAAKTGEFSAVFEGTKLQGCLIAMNGEGIIPGKKELMILFYINSKSKSWFEKKLSKYKNEKDVTVIVWREFRKHIPLFVKHGFAIDCVTLRGEPKTALKGLQTLKHLPKDLSHLGYTTRKMKTSDIPSVLQFFKVEFGRNPQFGWFCTHPSYLKARKKEFAKLVKNPSHLFTLVVDRGNRPVGYFGAYGNFKDKLWKRRVGIEIILSEKAQGKGIAKYAYLTMLNWMVKHRVRLFHGGTAQPAVLGLSKVMKRFPDVYMMNKRPAFFKSDHFLKALGKTRPKLAR